MPDKKSLIEVFEQYWKRPFEHRVFYFLGEKEQALLKELKESFGITESSLRQELTSGEVYPRVSDIIEAAADAYCEE
jgi:hypothetical protein